MKSMKDCPSPFQSETVAALIATGLAGLVSGSLAFGSFVDTRTLMALVHGETDAAKRKRNTDFIASTYFPVWWPNGRDWMAPLLMASSVAHFLTYYCIPSSKSIPAGSATTSDCPCQFTGNMSWIYSGLMLFGIAPYTAFVLGEDIEALRNASKTSSDEVAAKVKSFCTLHHARTVMAAWAFGLSLLSLVHLPRGVGGKK